MTARVVGSSLRNRSRKTLLALDAEPREPPLGRDVFGVRLPRAGDPPRDLLDALLVAGLLRAGFELFLMIAILRRDRIQLGWWAVWDSNPGPPA